MRQKNSYFGSIFERSKTSVLLHAVNRYAQPQLQYAVKIDASETAMQDSASSLGRVQRSPKIEEPALENVREASWEDIKGKSNNKDDSTELLKEESSSIAALRAKENIFDIKDPVLVPTAPEENITGKPSSENKSVKGEADESVSANLRSHKEGHQSKKQINESLESSVMDAVNKSASSSETIHRSLKTEKPVLETVTWGIPGRSNNRTGSTESLKEESISIPAARGLEIKDSVLVPTVPEENNPPGDNMTGKSSSQEDNKSADNQQKPVHLSEKVKTPNRNKRPELKVHPAVMQYKQSENSTAATSRMKTDRNHASDKLPHQYEKKKGEPSLVIKKIDIQIVDNRRVYPARTKKADNTESDVLSRSYLWRFNIS